MADLAAEPPPWPRCSTTRASRSPSSVLDADPDDDEWLRQINFDGVVNGTRAFLPILVEQDDGVIVNTSSVFGLAGMPYQSAYCASKFAVRGFTDSLRQELRGTGVRAVTVHPGGIRTNIARNARVRQDPEGRGRSHGADGGRVRGARCGPRRTRPPRSSAAASSGARPASWSARTPTSSTRWPGSRPRTTST